MQAEERGVDTGISNTQIDESYPYEKHKSGREMPGNSHVSHEESVNEESVNKPAGNTLHQVHPENQTMRTDEKSLDHGKREEMKHESPERHEEMKHDQHGEMKKEGYEQHGEIRHEGMKHEELKHRRDETRRDET